MKNKNSRVIVQMQAMDISATAWSLTDHFGFKAERGYLDVRTAAKDIDRIRLRRLDQVIELVQLKAGNALGQGTINHLALKSRDVDGASMALKAKWVPPDNEVTSDGPIDLPMFWSKGVRVYFAKTPDNASIELCQDYSMSKEETEQLVNVGGHDHYGVRCRDLKEAQRFYAGFGFNPVAEFEIPTPDGPIEIGFVERDTFRLEVASTPQTRADGVECDAHPVWSKLIIESDDPSLSLGENEGPNGEIIEIRPARDEPCFSFDVGDLP